MGRPTYEEKRHMDSSVWNKVADRAAKLHWLGSLLVIAAGIVGAKVVLPGAQVEAVRLFADSTRVVVSERVDSVAADFTVKLAAVRAENAAEFAELHSADSAATVRFTRFERSLETVALQQCLTPPPSGTAPEVRALLRSRCDALYRSAGVTR